MLFRSRRGDQRSGGIAGRIYGGGTIEQSSNAGDISLAEKELSSWSSEYAGGIVGIIAHADSSVVKSYNSGDLTIISDNSNKSHIAMAGGISANNSGTIENCYNEGDMVASATFTGENVNAGGIVAKSLNKSSILRSYNVGKLTGTNNGGICGVLEDNVTVEDCYWNNESEQYTGSVLIPASIRKGIAKGTGIVTGLTTTQMKQQSSYNSFDFETIWSMDSSKNSGYPSLQVKAPLYNVSLTDDGGTKGVATGRSEERRVGKEC